MKRAMRSKTQFTFTFLIRSLSSVGNTLKPPALMAKSVREPLVKLDFRGMLESGAAASCLRDSATDGENLFPASITLRKSEEPLALGLEWVLTLWVSVGLRTSAVESPAFNGTSSSLSIDFSLFRRIDFGVVGAVTTGLQEKFGFLPRKYDLKTFFRYTYSLGFSISVWLKRKRSINLKNFKNPKKNLKKN
jgi:hypothetical protein